MKTHQGASGHQTRPVPIGWRDALTAAVIRGCCRKVDAGVQTTKHARPLCASHDNSQSLRCRGQWFWWLVRAHSMAFEVSYNLENEQQFWDGERLACLRAAPPAVTPPVLTPPRRARRHCVHAMSGRGEHRQLSARVPQRHHELQMYAVHDFYRPPLTKDSRGPRQQVQRVEMHIPRAGGRAIQHT